MKYELLKIIFDFIIGIIWPVATLTIVLIYRKAILRLIDRARKLELPGGLALETVDEEIKQAKELAVEIKSERRPEVKKAIKESIPIKDNEINQKMIERKLTPSPSGLNLSYYKNIAETDPRLALVGLRIDFELMLKNLARGFKIDFDSRDSALQIISRLFRQGAITEKQYEFMVTIFKIGNAAAHGADISKSQALEVLDLGQVLVDDYIAWMDWGF